MRMEFKNEDVVAVYNGKAKTCCCGCAGTYSYASKHIALAVNSRGYDPSDLQEDVNDRKINLTANKVRKLMNNPAVKDSLMIFPPDYSRGTAIWVENEAGTRQYMVELNDQ